jgi:hypothetical protein
LSFDLLCRLSGLGLLQGLPLFKIESNLICAPCHHGKMITISHYLVNTVMTEQPDSYSIWTLSIPLKFAPLKTSGMSLSLLMTTIVTLEFSS